MKNRDDVKYEDLENFEEAIKAANTALQPSRVPESTKQILDDAKCLSLNNDSEDFWIIARSLKDFIDQHGVLPLKGSLPDMFSDSERYIKLLNIYHSKSALDAEQVYRKVQTHLESIGRSPVRHYYLHWRPTRQNSVGVCVYIILGRGIKSGEYMCIISTTSFFAQITIIFEDFEL